MRASSGIGVAASSGRSLLFPASALPNTCAIATLRNDDATYGRSFTYCWSAPADPPRTSPTGSTSSSTAAVHRSSDTSG
jgi:hypothetical protein